MNKLDSSDMKISPSELTPTYSDIKEYVINKYAVNVHLTYIVQVKEKLGLEKRENYNKPKKDKSKHPKVTKEKEEYIIEALKHFKVIN